MTIALRLALSLLGSLMLACVQKAPAQAPTPGTPEATASNSSSVLVAPDSVAKFKALYFPNNKVYGPLPEGFEQLPVLTEDNLRLNSWHLTPPTDGYLLLYFHGNGGNLTSLGPQFEAFRQAGAGVLAIDYRGYGESQGTPSEAGLYLDAEAAYDKALKLGYRPERVVIYGRSLGGGVATHLASKRPAAALILESTFTSVQDVALISHGAWAAKLVSGFPSLDRMPEIDVPTLIIHGTADTTIPPDMAEKLGAASPQGEVWMVERAGHNTVRKTAGKDYVARLTNFLNGLR